MWFEPGGVAWAKLAMGSAGAGGYPGREQVRDQWAAGREGASGPGGPRAVPGGVIAGARAQGESRDQEERGPRGRPNRRRERRRTLGEGVRG